LFDEVVIDPYAIAGAHVSIGNYSGTTDINGSVELAGIPLGHYPVTVTLPGHSFSGVSTINIGTQKTLQFEGQGLLPNPPTTSNPPNHPNVNGEKPPSGHQPTIDDELAPTATGIKTPKKPRLIVDSGQLKATLQTAPKGFRYKLFIRIVSTTKRGSRSIVERIKIVKNPKVLIAKKYNPKNEYSLRLQWINIKDPSLLSAGSLLSSLRARKK